MNYWIIALPRNRMEYCIQIGTFGLNRKYILGRVQEGDGVVCYVTKESKVIALGRVMKGYYLDDTPVFADKDLFGDSQNLYPDRFEFKARQLPRPEEIDFLQLIDQMSFIKNLAYWSVHFSSGIKEISKNDWDLVCSRCAISVE